MDGDTLEPTTSAHVDTFARDHLPPPEHWPGLPFDLPELRYPDRLNCAAELLGDKRPHRPAFRTPSGDLWTYGQLLARTDRIAHVLTAELGVVPGNRVLLRGPTTPWLAACWLAVLKAGAVAVTVLAQQRPHELTTMCKIAHVTHALCDVRSVDDLAKAEIPGLRITTYGGDAPDDLLLRITGALDEPFTAVDTAADDVALIAFTSGTTGRPKGCVHFHRDVLAIADTFSKHVLRPHEDDVFTGSPPLGFTFGLGGLVVFPMRAGACSLLLEQAGPTQLLPAITEHRVSVLFTAPTAYRAMLAELDGYDTTSLRRCVSAGENLPAATWRAWHTRTGLRIINGIGATELLHIFISAADEHIRPGTTGVPVPGWQARVVDAEGAPVPDGEPGLLAVRGPVGCRYLADPRQRRCARWLEHHRRHLCARPRRLLPLCRPRRRHDRLGGVQHRRARGRGRPAAPPGRGRDGRRGAARRRTRAGGGRVRGPQGGGTQGRRGTARLPQVRAGAVQVPPRVRLPGRAAPHGDGKAAALPAACRCPAVGRGHPVVGRAGGRVVHRRRP